MNKSELINAMAKDAGVSKTVAKKTLDAFLKNVKGSLESGNRVTLTGLGTWSVAKRSARRGRNPATGKPIKIAAKNVVKFKPGKDLSDKI